MQVFLNIIRILYLDQVQILLGADEIHFVQAVIDTDGPHVMSRFATVCKRWFTSLDSYTLNKGFSL